MTVIEPRYLRHAAKMAPAMPNPEKRLELCIISGWALVIAMFWFGWTSYSSIHWISPVLAGGLIGVGVLGKSSIYVSTTILRSSQAHPSLPPNRTHLILPISLWPCSLNMLIYQGCLSLVSTT